MMAHGAQGPSHDPVRESAANRRIDRGDGGDGADADAYAAGVALIAQAGL
jgi:hypothetical protein